MFRERQIGRPLLVALLEPANLSRGTLYKNGEFFGADVGIDDEFGRLPFGPRTCARTLHPPLGDDDDVDEDTRDERVVGAGRGQAR